MVQLFRDHTKEEHATSLAHYLPDGLAFGAKNREGTNLYKLLVGLGCELFRVEAALNTAADEHEITETTLFIEEWERAVGIPDTCLRGNGTLEERRNHVLLKLAGLNISTREDFIALAAALGFTVTIEGGTVHGLFPFTFPITFYASEKAARFTMIVTFQGLTGLDQFAFTFPFTFGGAIQNIVRCLFEKLKPANTRIVYQFNP